MLYDRVKWHYNSNVPWQDEDAVRSLIPAGFQGVTRGASGFRYDLTDHAEFQLPDPEWVPPPGLRGMIVRVADGVYREPVFSTHFRRMDDMLQRGILDYVMWYILPNPNVSNQRMIDAIAGQIRESGVTWGRKGHGFSVDDEPTPYHAQLTGQTMVDFRNALQDIYQREELHYVGLYNGNYGFIENQGWKLWAPWPTSNGALPSWTTNLVMQQWGVAGAGEVSGFPNRPVDVNHVWDQVVLDELTGRTATEENDLTPDERAMLEAVFHHVTDSNRLLTIGDISIALRGQLPQLEAVFHHVTDADRLLRISDDVTRLPGVIHDDTAKQLAGLSAAAVDVDALAKALAPLLNSGADAHAIAVEVAEVLGERLSTGGTEGGAS